MINLYKENSLMMTFEINTDLTEELLDDIIFEMKTENSSSFIFDFSQTCFVSSYCLVFLVGILNEFCERAHIRLIFSKKNALLYYCSRFGFFQALDSRIEVEPVSARRLEYVEDYRLQKDTILEITPISNEHISNIVGHVLRAMENVLNYDAIFAGNLAGALSELLINVIDHSEKEINCFASLQAYSRSRYAEISVMDTGIGIQGSLQKSGNYKLVGDISSIELALKKGVSRFDNILRGKGLFTCKNIARQYQGSLSIRSGTGIVIYNKGNSNSKGTVFFPGTQIRMKLKY